jgi:hypothetical protein
LETAYLSLKKESPDFIENLKKCFRGKPERKNLALKLYKQAMSDMINWLQEAFEKRDDSQKLINL